MKWNGHTAGAARNEELERRKERRMEGTGARLLGISAVTAALHPKSCIAIHVKTIIVSGTIIKAQFAKLAEAPSSLPVHLHRACSPPPLSFPLRIIGINKSPHRTEFENSPQCQYAPTPLFNPSYPTARSPFKAIDTCLRAFIPASYATQHFGPVQRSISFVG